MVMEDDGALTDGGASALRLRLMAGLVTAIEMATDDAIPNLMPVEFLGTGFGIGLAMALRHPEWMQAVALHDQIADDETNTIVDLLIQMVPFS